MYESMKALQTKLASEKLLECEILACLAFLFCPGAFAPYLDLITCADDYGVLFKLCMSDKVGGESDSTLRIGGDLNGF